MSTRTWRFSTDYGRLIGSSTSNVIIDVETSVLENVESFYVSTVMIPYSWYNVKNGFFEFTGSGGQVNFTISPGNYSGTALAAAIQTEMQSLDNVGVWSVSFDPISLFFTISNTVVGVFNIDDVGFGDILGWPDGSFPVASVAGPPGAGYVQGFVPYNLQPYQFIYLKSSTLGAQADDVLNKRSDNVIAMIPVNIVGGGYIIFNANTPPTIPFKNSGNLTAMDFQLVDSNNEIIDLNDLPFSVEIIFNLKDQYTHNGFSSCNTGTIGNLNNMYAKMDCRCGCNKC